MSLAIVSLLMTGEDNAALVRCSGSAVGYFVLNAIHTTPIYIIFAPFLALLRLVSVSRDLRKHHVKTLTECGYNSTTTAELETARHVWQKI
ncbi:Actin-2 [Echinococcus granulosus]|uniref:Actin-2 n=1 Tax=Echinococcus granulosus TaxID=6210 RepID=W6U0W4_ECHGR|nr:Actin-2 [Echinococcus granulosus]EUB54091.1 Actin-2 [Echinococcus granulosus]